MTLPQHPSSSPSTSDAVLTTSPGGAARSDTRPTCGFVPPYLLRHLVGEDHPTVAATEHPCGRTLAIDATFRQRREQATGEQPPVRAAAPSIQETDRWVIHSAGNAETLPGTVV